MFPSARLQQGQETHQPVRSAPPPKRMMAQHFVAKTAAKAKPESVLPAAQVNLEWYHNTE
jgi:hypothetical protein